MKNSTQIPDINLLKKRITSLALICLWLNAYPYKRYPKEKFERRFNKLIAIDQILAKECERRNFGLDKPI